MICKASLKYDVPLEMNLSGVRGWYLKENNLHYPNPHFWRIAGEMGVKTVIGVDAHDPKDFSLSNYKYGFDLIDKYQINFIADYRPYEKK
jgi:histidinol-phosphatase (PHP family)